MPRMTYGFDIAASVGGPLIDVRFSDGRQSSGWLKDKKFIRQMLKVDQDLLALYGKVVQALGSAYNVFARRKQGETRGTAFLAVTYEREGVQRKRWTAEPRDEVSELVEELQQAGFSTDVDGVPMKDDFVQILVPFRSVDEAVRAYAIIEQTVAASPKYWGW